MGLSSAMTTASYFHFVLPLLCGFKGDLVITGAPCGPVLGWFKEIVVSQTEKPNNAFLLNGCLEKLQKDRRKHTLYVGQMLFKV